MNSTFWNLARKIASDLNTVQLSFAMLLGYVEGSEDGVPGFPMGDNVAENLPKIAHIGGDEDMRLKHGDGSVTLCHRKRKDGTFRRYWQGRYFFQGKYKAVYADTKAACLDKLKALREECARRAAELEETEEQNALPVRQHYGKYADWLDDWLNLCKLGKLKRTYGDELVLNVGRVKQAIGQIPLKALSPLDVLNYIARLPRQNITVKLYDVVNGSLQKAEDFGLIKRNPCRAIDRPTYDKQEKRPFELREQRAMLETLEGKHRELYFFLCCTGLRIGELLALDESKIDFARNVIRVTESAQLKTGERVSPKTKTSVRNVYFAPQLFEVFDIGNLGNYTYSGIKKAFCKAYHKLELAEGISLTHSCRHTYASLLNAAGVGMKKIQMQMGHADITTTMGIYTDLLQAGESSPIYEYIVQLKAVIDGHIL